MQKSGLIFLIIGSVGIGILIHPLMVFAQLGGNVTVVPPVAVEQTTGEVWVGIVLAIISMAGTIFNTYLANKAKITGEQPNATDAKIAQAIEDISEKFTNSEAKMVDLIDFVYNALPDKAQAIVDKPKIKVQEITKDLGKAEEQTKKIGNLVSSILDVVAAKKQS